MTPETPLFLRLRQLAERAFKEISENVERECPGIRSLVWSSCNDVGVLFSATLSLTHPRGDSYRETVVVSIGCGRSADQARVDGCIMLDHGCDLAEAPDASHPLSVPPAELLEAVAASIQRTLEYLRARQGLIVSYLRTGHVEDAA